MVNNEPEPTLESVTRDDEAKLRFSLASRRSTFNPEEFHAKVGEAVAKAIEEISPEKMVDSLIKDAYVQRKDILTKLMGFDNRWGKWEIYATNGHRGAVTEEIQDALRPKIRQWIDEVFAENEDAIEKRVKVIIKRALIDSNDYEIRKMVGERTQHLAKQLSDALFRQLAAEYRTDLGIRDPISLELPEQTAKAAR